MSSESLRTIQDTLSSTAASAKLTVNNLLPSGSLATKPDGWLSYTTVERPAPDEDEKSEQIAEIVQKIVRKNKERYGKGLRATHVKTQGIVKGSLQVNSDLPEHLQYGLFKSPGKTYKLIARYANEPSHIMDDKKPSPRGMAIKVFGVEGKFMQDSVGHTQDLHFNNAPSLELTNLDTTLEIFSLRWQYFEDPDGLNKALEERNDTSKQMAPMKLPNQPIVSMPMFTQSAFRHGPYVAHYSLKPVTDLQDKLSKQSIPSDAPEDIHRQQLQEYYKENIAIYTIRAQFASDLSQHSVDDAAVVWPESTSPYYDLGIITFPSQITWTEAKIDWWETNIALSPFNGLVEHQPLGSVNRLRKKVYIKGREMREQVNGKKVYFPTSASEMPE